MIVKLCKGIYANTDEITHVDNSGMYDYLRVHFKNSQYIVIEDEKDAKEAKEVLDSISTVNQSRLKNEAYDLKQCIKFKQNKLKSEGHKHD